MKKHLERNGMKERPAVEPGYEWVALSVTTVGALLASVQSSALLIGLPDLMAELHASFLTTMWVLLGYLLITTAVVPVVGRLADMFGRKNLYNAGFAVFTLGSLLAGLAQPSFHGLDLVAFRMLQGIGGALLMTNSTAIVTDAFRRGRIGLGLGVNQIAAVSGFLIGPVVGGLLTALSWRWVFLVNVPLGVFGTLWAMRRLREPVALPGGQTFDWPGSLTFTIGLASLLIALSLLAFPMLSMTFVAALFVVAVVGLALFVLVEGRQPQPVLDPRLFRNVLFAFAVAANALNGLARGAVLFLLTFFLQGPYGQDPLMAGLMLAPFGAAFLVVGPISGYLSDRYGSRELATIGLAISALGLLGLSTLVATTPYWLLAVDMAVVGGGSGFFSSPNTNAIMTSVPPERRGTASGTRLMLGNTGQMLSIAITFPLVLSKIPQDVMMHIFLYGGGLGGQAGVLDAFESGLHVAFIFSFAVTVVAAVVSFFRPRQRGLPDGKR